MFRVNIWIDHMVWSAEFLREVILCSHRVKKGLDHSAGNASISFYLTLKAASCLTQTGLALANTSRQRVVIMSSEEPDCDMFKVF